MLNTVYDKVGLRLFNETFRLLIFKATAENRNRNRNLASRDRPIRETDYVSKLLALCSTRLYIGLHVQLYMTRNNWSSSLSQSRWHRISLHTAEIDNCVIC